MDRPRPGGTSTRSTRAHGHLVAWLAPAITVGLAFLVDGLATATRLSRVLGMMVWGVLLLGIALIIVTHALLLASPLLRVIFTWVNAGSAIACIVAMIAVSFQGFRVLLAITTWGAIYGAWRYRDDFRAVRQRVPAAELGRWLRARISRQRLHRIFPVAAIVALVATPGAFLLAAPAWNLQERVFTVTAQQAAATDIVLYYACGTPGEYASRHDVIDVAKDFNVTLSIAWHVSCFNDTTPGTLGHEMANFTREANAKGVKIEYFPCFHFNWEYILDGGHVEGAGLTLTWHEYWTLFKTWIAREGISVDYVLWDMEGGSSPASTAGLPDSIWYLPATRIIGLQERARELPLIRAEFERIIAETAGLGARTRITTWSPADAMDGDHDLLLLLGQFAYVFDDLIQDGSIEYVSTMAYTNGWGDVHPDNASGRECVYECARQLRSLHPDKVGICIGNINGNGLTTIEEVVNEYHLAIAGGATSVRLFNGASWVNGWDYAVVGPEWGANGTRDLFEACRAGGTGRFTENFRRTCWQFEHELWFDLVLNPCKW